MPWKYHALLRDLYRRVKYFGFKFKCPFCKGNFRKLIPSGSNFPVLKEKKVIGSGYRLNVVCPCCHSKDRERLIYLYLKNKTNIFSKNLKVLHVSPEEALQKILMALPNINYLAANLNPQTAMVKMDITDINYKDNSFDVVICNHVLEHIINDEKAMSELYRVLKPGGWAILQVPISLLLTKTLEDPSITSPREREEIFGQDDHVRIYGKDYKNRLEKTGFCVEIYNFAKEFGERVSHKYGLITEEDLYICQKPEYEKSNIRSRS